MNSFVQIRMCQVNKDPEFYINKQPLSDSVDFFVFYISRSSAVCPTKLDSLDTPLSTSYTFFRNAQFLNCVLYYSVYYISN